MPLAFLFHIVTFPPQFWRIIKPILYLLQVLAEMLELAQGFQNALYSTNLEIWVVILVAAGLILSVIQVLGVIGVFGKFVEPKNALLSLAFPGYIPFKLLPERELSILPSVDANRSLCHSEAFCLRLSARALSQHESCSLVLNLTYFDVRLLFGRAPARSGGCHIYCPAFGLAHPSTGRKPLVANIKLGFGCRYFRKC